MAKKNKSFFSPKKILKASVNECMANLMAVQLYPLGILHDRKNAYLHPKHATNPRPILLVHGIVHNRSAFIGLKRRLQKQGWHNIYTINYNTYNGSLTHMVGKISKRVDYILKKSQAQQIDIVAHSLGGLVGRYYMSIGEGRGKVKELITLGTPHQGTNFSHLLQFLPGSSLGSDLHSESYLLQILQQSSLPKGSRITNIYSPYDWTIWPKTQSLAEGQPSHAFRNLCIDSVGHTGFLYSEQVFDTIVSTLGNQSFQSKQKSANIGSL